MKPQAFQPGEIRDENDNIIQEGAYGKKTAFANKQNLGIIDYIINNFAALHDAVLGNWLLAKSKSAFPNVGDTSKIYIADDTGKAYRWNGTEYVEMTQQAVQFTAQEVLELKKQAESAANAAASSAKNSNESKEEAKKSETNAGKSEQNASKSKEDAAASASTAKEYADVAQGLYKAFCLNIVGPSASTMNNAGIIIGASASGMKASEQEGT